MDGLFPRLFLLSLLVGFAVSAFGQGAVLADTATAVIEPFLLDPPDAAGPVEVSAAFSLQDINDVSDAAETFEFIGVLTLRWRDPRQAFDPVISGVDEKVFQGSFQFDEISPGWYPQVVLVNESGLFQQSGVLVRLRPDGTATLVQTINAMAEADFDLRRFPLDSQRLEATFEILGFDRDEVRLQVTPDHAEVAIDHIQVPQWRLRHATLEVRERTAAYAGSSGTADALVLEIDVERESWYTRRLIVFPLVLIVLLSFSVFWMDRSSLGDRLNVSFIGILSAVAYQIVTSDQLPRISEVTLMHGFLTLSLVTMCATVVINLVVGAVDKRGRLKLGDTIDRSCRWIFPSIYFGLIGLMVVYAELLF